MPEQRSPEEKKRKPQRSPEAIKRREQKHNQWIENHYDRIRVTCPKGRKAVYQQAADAEDKSLNKWIVDILESEIQKSEKDGPSGQA